MPRMRRFSVVLAPLAAGLLGMFAACFSEADPIGCTPGSNGCECSEGTCDGSLECNADSNCVDPDCTVGAASCTCYGNGTCDPGLSCESSLCQPAEGATGSVSATGTGNASGTDDGPGSSDTAAGTTEAADGTSTGAATGHDGTEGGDCGGCPIGDACFPGGQCSPTPYVPCGLEGACPVGVCEDLGQGAADVCAPPCRDVSECPQIPGVTVECIQKSGCKIVCENKDDCGSHPGVTCIDGEFCGFPTQ